MYVGDKKEKKKGKKKGWGRHGARRGRRSECRYASGGDGHSDGMHGDGMHAGVRGHAGIITP